MQLNYAFHCPLEHELYQNLSHADNFTGSRLSEVNSISKLLSCRAKTSFNGRLLRQRHSLRRKLARVKPPKTRKAKEKNPKERGGLGRQPTWGEIGAGKVASTFVVEYKMLSKNVT